MLAIEFIYLTFSNYLLKNKMHQVPFEVFGVIQGTKYTKLSALVEFEL